ncbi:MAG: helix-turn-helix transcriptional regulator [Lachnospiraceae bacterium]
MEFSEKLRQLREEKHLTQEQVARELGVSRQAISNWENNKNLPRIWKRLSACPGSIPSHWTN